MLDRRHIPVNANGAKAKWGFAGLVCQLPKVMLVALIAGFAFAPGALANEHQSGDAVVRCNPESAVGITSEVISVDLYVENVQNLYGADLQLEFDETIARVKDEDPNTPGVQIQLLSTFLAPGFTLFKDANNETGSIHYATTQLNPASPVSGSGPVARVRFEGLRAGTFTMTYVLHDLADRNGVLIPSTARTCFVTFNDPSAVTLNDFNATSSIATGIQSMIAAILFMLTIAVTVSLKLTAASKSAR